MTANLPTEQTNFATFTTTFAAGPRGFQAFSTNNMGTVFARTAWLPTLADALTALTAAQLAPLTRSAAHTTRTLADD